MEFTHNTRNKKAIIDVLTSNPNLNVVNSIIKNKNPILADLNDNNFCANV